MYEEGVVSIGDVQASQMAVPIRHKGWEDLQGQRRIFASNIEVHDEAYMAWLGRRAVDVQQLKLCTRHVLLAQHKFSMIIEQT